MDDVWIGATALEHRLNVVTRNLKHFRRIPGLVSELWWIDERPLKVEPRERTTSDPRFRPTEFRTATSQIRLRPTQERRCGPRTHALRHRVSASENRDVVSLLCLPEARSKLPRRTSPDGQPVNKTDHGVFIGQSLVIDRSSRQVRVAANKYRTLAGTERPPSKPIHIRYLGPPKNEGVHTHLGLRQRRTVCWKRRKPRWTKRKKQNASPAQRLALAVFFPDSHQPWHLMLRPAPEKSSSLAFRRGVSAERRPAATTVTPQSMRVSAGSRENPRRRWCFHSAATREYPQLSCYAR